MTRFVVGDDRSQSALLPALLDDYVDGDNPVRAANSWWMISNWVRSASTMGAATRFDHYRK